MSAEPEIRVLLDEHYPAWLAERLTEEGLDAMAVIARDDLRGRPDDQILRTAVQEHRILVTEDVRTMPAAARLVPDHAGIVYCPSHRFGRDRAALDQLRRALVALVNDSPPGIGSPGFVWWLRLPSPTPSSNV